MKKNTSDLECLDKPWPISMCCCILAVWFAVRKACSCSSSSARIPRGRRTSKRLSSTFRLLPGTVEEDEEDEEEDDTHTKDDDEEEEDVNEAEESWPGDESNCDWVCIAADCGIDFRYLWKDSEISAFSAEKRTQTFWLRSISRTMKSSALVFNSPTNFMWFVDNNK